MTFAVSNHVLHFLWQVPLAPGEQAPRGVVRIEAVTLAGVDNINAGLAVTVGVMDSGIDSTHPDINYVGGTSWVNPAASVPGDSSDPGVDMYGERAAKYACMHRMVILNTQAQCCTLHAVLPYCYGTLNRH